MAKGKRGKSQQDDEPSSPSTTEEISLKEIYEELKELRKSVEEGNTKNQELAAAIPVLSREIKLLQIENKDLKAQIKAQGKQLISLESHHFEKDQYNRRNNIEIAGIPNNIDDKNLESKLSKLRMSLKLTSNLSTLRLATASRRRTKTLQKERS